MEENMKKPKEVCFWVKDGSLRKGNASPIFGWLEMEGFSQWGQIDGYYGMDWIFININKKTYGLAQSRIGRLLVIGGHPIRFDEFKQIYEIYRRYEGLDPTIMTREEQRKRDEEKEKEQEDEEKYWHGTIYQEFTAEVERILESEYRMIPPEEREALLQEEEGTLIRCFREQIMPKSAASQLYCWWAM